MILYDIIEHALYSVLDSLIKYIIIMCIFNFIFFFFNDTATTDIYTLSLHDALPILSRADFRAATAALTARLRPVVRRAMRSEEHTSELQSRRDLVCRLLLEKKKKRKIKKKYFETRET